MNVTGFAEKERNYVLRNTYWLLALTLLPTIGGAWAGMTMGFAAITGWGFLALFAVLIGFIFAIQYFEESPIGFVLLLAFTFFFGLLLTPQLTQTLKYSNGGTLIMLAAAGTAVILACLATYATITKRDFSGMGRFLFIALLLLVLGGIANIFLHIQLLTIAFSVIAIVIFSAYIIYDVQRIVNGGETSYIAATLGLYLDIMNVFVNLLNLLGMGFGNDD